MRPRRKLALVVALGLVAFAALTVRARAGGLTFGCGPLYAGLIRTPPFGPDATGPGDPRHGLGWERWERSGRGWTAYLGLRPSYPQDAREEAR